MGYDRIEIGENQGREMMSPWEVGKKTSKGYPIKKKTGEVVGYSKTKEKAEGAVRARYANYGKKK